MSKTSSRQITQMSDREIQLKPDTPRFVWHISNKSLLLDNHRSLYSQFKQETSNTRIVYHYVPFSINYKKKIFFEKGNININ
uniref:Putative ovule protein n=1 Tax=Solanum chacoense TaxID=4108 RepID=A0A0V0HM47_SOLCH